jgi:predicted dehydrogenase
MKQVTAILIGAGQRGVEAYSSYALKYPNEFKVVGVAEPKIDRREAFCNLHHIPSEASYSSWEDILEQPKMADCVMICTQDKMHYEPVMKALSKGYHVLCEKPMSPDKNEILAMGEAADLANRILCIAHVLRYSPFFTTLKKMLDEGAVGELVAIQHSESVGYWHAAHSFVRGNWRSKEETSPIILAKCCHDMDILLWLIGSRCSKVSSFGSLSHFRKEKAPEGAPKYCMDGCNYRDNCPYYAPRFYLEHPRAIADGFASTVSLNTSPEAILEALKKGPYGRCVYHCDNDVVDHQVVNLEYENGVTANFIMSAFTQNCERVINIMGTKGQLRGNMEEDTLELIDFITGNKTKIALHTPSVGHSGSDAAMMKEFVSLVSTNGTIASKTSADFSVESHLIALAAEESRIMNGNPINMKYYT